jgi:hypothetical protein
MRFVLGVLACMCVGGVSLVLADPAPVPTAPSTPTAPAAPTAAATPAPTALAAAKSQAAPAAAVAAADEEEKRFIAQGYRMEMHHGEKVFCRREEVLGSRLGGQKVCATAEQLKLREQVTKELVEKAQRQQSIGPSGR